MYQAAPVQKAGLQRPNPLAPEGTADRARYDPPPQASLLPSPGGWGGSGGSFQPSSAGGTGIAGMLAHLDQQQQEGPHCTNRPPASSSDPLIQGRNQSDDGDVPQSMDGHRTTSWPALNMTQGELQSNVRFSVPIPPIMVSSTAKHPSLVQQPPASGFQDKGREAPSPSSGQEGPLDFSTGQENAAGCSNPSCSETAEAYHSLMKLLKVCEMRSMGARQAI